MKTCPKCKQKTISTFKGFLFGPMIALKCKKCNANVYMDIKKYYIAALPFVMSFIFVQFIQTNLDPTIKFFLVVIGLILSSILNIKIVTLTTSDPSNKKLKK